MEEGLPGLPLKDNGDEPGTEGGGASAEESTQQRQEGERAGESSTWGSVTWGLEVGQCPTRRASRAELRDFTVKVTGPHWGVWVCAGGTVSFVPPKS